MRSSVADEGEAQGEAPEQEPSQEELLRQLEAEFKQLKVGDVLVQTVFTVSSLGYRSLGEEDRDLEQAKLAIDALRALVPAIKDAVAGRSRPRSRADGREHAARVREGHRRARARVANRGKPSL